ATTTTTTPISAATNHGPPSRVGQVAAGRSSRSRSVRSGSADPPFSGGRRSTTGPSMGWHGRRRFTYRPRIADSTRGGGRVAKYVAKRLVALVVILFLVSLGTFFLVHLLPGKPAITILGTNATPQNIAIVNHQLGLDKPLWQQYFIWLGHLFGGNLGQSFTTHQSVGSIIANAFPIDVELIVISQILAFAVAIPLTTTAARRPNRAFDSAATGTTFAMLALPPFILAPVLVLLFSVDLHVFPGP